ncbi:putative toxin-antitoxin system toxin component, PIN family [Candidatus Eisenbacteria bacterium]|uniref:Toxin-antitoxin system toxin component, PIN family n=1 Tax=Eiseniibacteriota bacterium TaxID=2212470 RepID=A0ABV6YPX9_UNCEI
MRIVLDSNVIVAAFATRGLCAALFEHCVENHEIFLCNAMLKEITRVLRKRIKVPRPTVDQIESYLRSHTSLVRPARIDPRVCRDKKDLPVLGCTLSSLSEFLITGDDDLLTLGSFEGTDIVTPRQFWERVKTGRQG